MKPFFDPGRRPKTICLSLALIAAVAAGCGKSNTSPPAAAPAQGPAAPVASAPAVAVSTAPATPQQPAASVDNSKQTLQMLNRSLMQWMIKNRRHPRTFQEFAGTANIPIPSPPAGKEYALNGRGFIVLVNISTQ